VRVGVSRADGADSAGAGRGGSGKGAEGGTGGRGGGSRLSSPTSSTIELGSSALRLNARLRSSTWARGGGWVGQNMGVSIGWEGGGPVGVGGWEGGAGWEGLRREEGVAGVR
jgi:hypothetical protein